MEVVAQCLDRCRRAGATVGVLRPRGAVDLALRIDPEGAILLDDPPVVALLGIVSKIPGSVALMLLIDELDLEARTCREIERDRRRRVCGRLLRILDVVGEAVRARGGRHGAQGAVGVDRCGYQAAGLDRW